MAAMKARADPRQKDWGCSSLVKIRASNGKGASAIPCQFAAYLDAKLNTLWIVAMPTPSDLTSELGGFR